MLVTTLANASCEWWKAIHGLLNSSLLITWYKQTFYGEQEILFRITVSIAWAPDFPLTLEIPWLSNDSNCYKNASPTFYVEVYLPICLALSVF